MTWLVSRPAAVLIVGCLGVALVVAVGTRMAVRAFVPAAEHEHTSATAAALMTALGAAFAILTALTLANEAGYLSSAQTIVSNEAADTARLAWASTTPGVHTAAIQAAMVRYLEATRTHEWHGANAANGDDAATSAALADLEIVVRTQAARPDVGTPASNEILASLDALTSDRRARLAAASRTIPGLYVLTLVVTDIALIVNASVLTIRGRWRAALLVGSLAVVIGLSMALLFALGTPWQGPIEVSGQPIDAVVRDLRTGYFHM